jgi:polyhydroxyalkanoate synthesis regulator phasin
MEAVASGEITPDEALKLMQAVGVQLRIVEAEEMAKRIEALEQALSRLFDWHASLVDTSEALYHALDDRLPQLEALGLRDRKTGEASVVPGSGPSGSRTA